MPPVASMFGKFMGPCPRLSGLSEVQPPDGSAKCLPRIGVIASGLQGRGKVRGAADRAGGMAYGALPACRWRARDRE